MEFTQKRNKRKSVTFPSEIIIYKYQKIFFSCFSNKRKFGVGLNLCTKFCLFLGTEMQISKQECTTTTENNNNKKKKKKKQQNGIICKLRTSKSKMK